MKRLVALRWVVYLEIYPAAKGMLDGSYWKVRHEEPPDTSFESAHAMGDDFSW